MNRIITYHENVQSHMPKRTSFVSKTIFSSEILDVLHKHNPDYEDIVGIKTHGDYVFLYLQNFDAENGVFYDRIDIQQL